MSKYRCTECEREFMMNKPTNFALALQKHHDCPEYEYEDADDGVLAEKVPMNNEDDEAVEGDHEGEAEHHDDDSDEE